MKTPPLCRYCGGPIRKDTKSIHFRVPTTDTNFSGYVEVEALPQTKAEAQKLTNARVMSVRRTCRLDYVTDKAIDIGINRITTWDGESYVDEFFCNGDHARRFAYASARAGHCTKAYTEATRKKDRNAA